MNKLLPPPKELAALIKEGKTSDELRRMFGLKSKSPLFKYVKYHKLPRPADYKPPARPPVTTALPLEVRLKGPQPDARRVVINGISLPRLKFLHGEFDEQS